LTRPGIAKLESTQVKAKETSMHKVNSAGNKHTLKQQVLKVNDCEEASCHNVHNEENGLLAAKLITGNSQLSVLLKSACHSQHKAWSNEIKNTVQVTK